MKSEIQRSEAGPVGTGRCETEMKSVTGAESVPGSSGPQADMSGMAKPQTGMSEKEKKRRLLRRKKTAAKEKTEEKLLRFSFVCSLLFTITEVIAALFLHSYSVMMDGVFDLADLVLMGPFLVLVPLLYKPVTEKHPYGYSQVESVFLIIKYGILLLVTIVMIAENIHVIMEGGHHVDAGSIAIYEIVIGTLCLLVLLILIKMSKKYNSPTITAEIFLWKEDVVGSMGVGVAFLAQELFGNTFLAPVAPYMDSAVAIVLAATLLREPIESIYHGFRNLMLFAPDEETMNHLRACVDESLENYPYSCSFLDVIQTGRKVWIEVYLTADVQTSLINVRDWAAIRRKLWQKLEGEFDQIYIELIPDMPEEPV